MTAEPPPQRRQFIRAFQCGVALIKAMHGHIELATASSGGLEVSFRLPLTGDADQSADGEECVDTGDRRAVREHERPALLGAGRGRGWDVSQVKAGSQRVALR
ncbi:hypothetical protein ABZ801_09915 [Actinomadura sp. NPDC047616]|uniref:hypothetical protein n=1 Tax=Actinomadura sp. NPDC047616 TaxID=3155914 RepID=UPI0033F7B23C